LRRETAAELGRLLARANRRLAAPGGD